MKNIFVLSLFSLFLGRPSQAGFFGAWVHHYKGSVTRMDKAVPYMTEIQLTVLAVYPQLPPSGNLYNLYDGIDKESLAPVLEVEGFFGANRISHYLMDIIQNAYYKIADDRGLFKIGSAFQKELATSEPFWDGRSAAIGLFEGSDFSHPLATFRVAYSTPDHRELPVEERLHVKLSDYRPQTAATEIQPAQINSELGLNFTERQVVEDMSRYFMKSKDAGSLFLGHIMKMLPPAISTGHKFRLPDGRIAPFAAVLEAAHKPIIIGGPSAELKGLSQAFTEQKTDYLHFLFLRAIEAGFFDIIPHINGYGIPTSFAAETPVGHIDGHYKSWDWMVLDEVDDPVFHGKVALVEFLRQNLGNLIPKLFNKATSGIFPTGETVSKINDFEAAKKLFGKSEAETLTLDPQAVPIKLDVQNIFLHDHGRGCHQTFAIQPESSR